MLLHGMYDNVLIPNLYYLGMYQTKGGNESSTILYSFLGVGTKINPYDKIVVHVFPTIFGIKNIYNTLINWMGYGCVGIILFWIKY